MRNFAIAILALCLLGSTAVFAGPRETVLDQMPIVFRPSVFTGEKFPAGDFEYPDVAKAVVGEYQLRITYYDAEQNEVKSAAKPGRYGAVVEIAVDGKKARRFVTLYRRPGAGRPRWQPMEFGAARLPADMGIDPAVLSEQERHVAGLFRDLAQNAAMQPGSLAAGLAGLSEMKPGSGPLPERLDPMHRDRAWWYAMGKKLGEPAGYPYWPVLPAGYDKDPAKKWPLIMFLHGSGERGEDMAKVRVHGPHKYWEGRPDQPFVMIYPQVPSKQMWWFSEALNDVLDEVQRKYRIDPDRIYLTGLSMGGFGSWDWSMANPERFAAVVPICGRGDATDAARIKDIPVWVFHGLKDPVVSPRFSIELVEALAKVNGRVRYTFYPEAGHDSWTEAYKNPELYEWLLSQRRGEPKQPPLSGPLQLPRP